VRDLGVRYGVTAALEGVTFEVDAGEVVAVVGPNGAGKSSLFRAIVGLVPYEGDVVLHGRTCHHRTHRIAASMIPQRSAIDLDFPVSVAQVVRSGRRPFSGPGGWPRRADRQAVDVSLDRVGLFGFGNRPLRTLSGGELQRVMLARSLAQDAGVLLLDEALSGVDQPATLDLLALLHELAADGAAVMLSTHDLALARHRFDRCLA
jgi:manganese transport system ATP-binding protein